MKGHCDFEFGAASVVDRSMDVEPEVRELSDRIAAARAAIEGEKAARARIEATLEPAVVDEAEHALATLREEVTAAHARLAMLQRKPTPSKRARADSAGQVGPYLSAFFVGAPSLVVLIAMLVEEPVLDMKLVLVFAAPLLLAILLVVRGKRAGDLI